MKKLVYIAAILGMLVIVQDSYAQFKEWGTKFGIRYNQLFPGNEFKNVGFGGNDEFNFDSYKFSYLAEAFFAFELTKALELQLTGGYGTYAGKAMFAGPEEYGEYESTIIPLNLRLRVSPWDMKGWNPYLYAGAGMMNYSVDTEPTIPNPVNPVEKDGWVGIFPFGIGSEFALSENVLLDFGVGGAVSSSYDLDGYNGNTGVWDAWWSTSLGLTFTGESCSSDRDNDGLGKCTEEQLGTNPKNPDTDGDGLNDGEEVNTYKTNPLQADSDLDGLDDRSEVVVHKTNPMMADTDSDGLNDGEEYNKYKTDPLKADTDGDGLTDGDEVVKYKTNPLSADTDGDGLTDGEEVTKYNTNPLMADSDSDGLSDAEEVITYKTDPNKKDTDGGSVDDFTEVKRGTNPLDAEDDVVKIGVPIVLEGITFATGKADITPESEQILMKAYKTLETYPDISVEISGHTDDVGSASSNQKLSQRRADAVKAWLVAKGISADRMTAVGYGEEKPRVANDSAENRRLNRRIEFKRTK